MKRRTCLKTLLTAGVGAAGVGAAGTAAAAMGHPIVLQIDLAVDPAKEKDMVHNFETIFRPEASKHAGFITVELLKLRSAVKGSTPPGVNYRFSLTYRSEEQRQAWAATAEHQKVWPTIETTLVSNNYNVLLFDMV